MKEEYIYIKNARFTTSIQQLYNNPSDEGEPQYKVVSFVFVIGLNYKLFILILKLNQRSL